MDLFRSDEVGSGAALIDAVGAPALYNATAKFTPPAGAVGFKIDPNLGDLPISALIQPAETGADAVAGTYVSLGCQPTLKIKLSKTITNPSDPGHIASAALKAAKGIKALTVIPGSTLNFAG